MALRKLPIVGIFGSGAPIGEKRATLAREAGAMIAQLGAHLLTGAGFGVMEAAADGFTSVADRQGYSIGLVPRSPHGALDEPNRSLDGTPYPNRFIEIAVFTALPPRVADWQTLPSRNHVNVLTVDAALVLPGGPGTTNELDMALFYRGEGKRSRASCPIVLLGPAGEFDDARLRQFERVERVAQAQDRLRHFLAEHARKAVPEAAK